MAVNSDTITLSSGATSVALDNIDIRSIYPVEPKNFTMHTISNNAKVFDVEANKKKRWEFEQNVPLNSTKKADLQTLYDLTESITLTEDFVESSVTYTVFFENMQKRFETEGGDTRYNLIFQEV